MLEFWRVSATLALRWPHLNGSPAVGSGGRLSRTNPSTWPRKKRKCCAFLHSSVFLLGFVCLFPCVSLVVVDAARVSFDLVSSLFGLLFAGPFSCRRFLLSPLRQPPTVCYFVCESRSLGENCAQSVLYDDGRIKGSARVRTSRFFPSAPASLSLSHSSPLSFTLFTIA